MRVAIYARYSSDKQSENTIEAQQRICREYCERHGYEVVAYYTDRALTARKNVKKRRDFQRMIKDSEKKKFDAVLVFKLERFARNRYDSAVYKARLKKNGVRVISATENISGDKESIILESVLEGMAEYFSADLSEKVRAGMHQNALRHENNGGATPLGYKILDKKLVIDPLTAPIVKEAFERYAQGESIVSIYEDFNEKGYRTSRGGKFNKNSFHHMFKNKKYIGTYVYDNIEVDDVIPAIISREVFDTVQERLKIRKSAPNTSSSQNEYLLSLKLICGECGNTMTGTTGTSKNGKKYFYYECTNRKKQTCSMKSVRRDVIDEKVINETIKLFTPTLIDDLADMAMIEVERENNNNTLVPAIMEEIDFLEQSINNLVKVLEHLPDSPSTIARLKELETQKKAAQRRLIEEQSNIIKLDRDMIVFWLTKFLDGDIEDAKFRKNLISLLVNTVTLKDYDNLELDIIYNLTGEQNP